MRTEATRDEPFEQQQQEGSGEEVCPEQGEAEKDHCEESGAEEENTGKEEVCREEKGKRQATLART